MTAAANKAMRAMRAGHEAWREKIRRRCAIMTDEQLREALLCDLRTSRRMLAAHCAGDPLVSYLLDRIGSIYAFLVKLGPEEEEIEPIEAETEEIGFGQNQVSSKQMTR